jgi:hypothetical protein
MQQSIRFRDYLKENGRSRLIGDAFSIACVIAAGQVLVHARPYISSIAVLVPVMTDPFTVLAASILILSYTDLEFMEFRLKASGVPAKLSLDRLARQEEIARDYERRFGKDIFTRAWRLRLLFLFSFAIAAVRWVVSWG